ncbi:armadillo repeat-containing protein 10 isoform X1 [Prinia subflava]|uniref:armadillo repeat-containing protein 10 isoform X1 n=1 Tax=Prinia subflava TaxID=208062 RepID=UPI002FE19F9A
MAPRPRCYRGSLWSPRLQWDRAGHPAGGGGPGAAEAADPTVGMMCPRQGLPWRSTALPAGGTPLRAGRLFRNALRDRAGPAARAIPSCETETASHRCHATPEPLPRPAHGAVGRHPSGLSRRPRAQCPVPEGRAEPRPSRAGWGGGFRGRRSRGRGDVGAAGRRGEGGGRGPAARGRRLLLPVAAGGGRAATSSGRAGPAGSSPPVSTHTMDVDVLQKLIHLLQATDDPLIQEQALITLSNSAAFSVNQDIIRNLDGLSVIGGMLSNCVPKVKEKALNALNNLSMNIKNQEEIQVFITQVCRTVESAPLNSDVQLAGLRLLTNMSVTSDYHQKMINSIPCFLHLLSEGTERTQIQVLKVLVNLSANPDMTRYLLRTQVPSLVLLFDSCINRDILVRALVFAANLKKNMNHEEGTVIEEYNEDSIFFTLCRDSGPFAQRLASLLHHPDTEVKEQVVRILTQ